MPAIHIENYFYEDDFVIKVVTSGNFFWLVIFDLLDLDYQKNNSFLSFSNCFFDHPIQTS